MKQDFYLKMNPEELVALSTIKAEFLEYLQDKSKIWNFVSTRLAIKNFYEEKKWHPSIKTQQAIFHDLKFVRYKFIAGS